jgi:hypothetical protein
MDISMNSEVSLIDVLMDKWGFSWDIQGNILGLSWKNMTNHNM